MFPTVDEQRNQWKQPEEWIREQTFYFKTISEIDKNIKQCFNSYSNEIVCFL